MPSNKPRLATYTSNTIIKKFQYISDYEKRSASKELEYIVEQYINNFENIHGKLIIEDDGSVHPKQIITNDTMGKSSTFKVG